MRLMPHRQLPVERSRSIALFLVVAFVWTWSFEIAGRVTQDGDPSIEKIAPWLIVASFGPTLGAVLAAARERRLKILASRFGPFRQSWRVWLLASYALVPAAFAMALAFSGGAFAEASKEAGLLVFVPIIGLVSVVGGPLGEELGWRGVLLPWLLERVSVVSSALIVGAIWAVWHAPLWTFDDFIPGLSAATFIPLYVASLVAFSLVMTFLHLQSQGSVLVAMLAHGVFNSVLLPFDALYDDGVLSAQAAWPFVLATVLTGLVVAALLARKRWQPSATLAT